MGPFRLQGVRLHSVQQLLHPFCLEGGAEVHRKQLPLHHQGRQLLPGQLFPGQVALHQFFAAQGRSLPPGLGVCHIHKALAQTILQLPEKLSLAGVWLVHLVDKDKDGHPRLLQQPPQGLGVALHPVGGADHQDGTVQHLQGPLGLSGEVHVSRRVHQGQLQLPPAQNGLLGVDGNAPFPLQLLSVQKGIPVVHPPQGADGSGHVEHGLGQGGLSRVHMGQNAGCQSSHWVFPLLMVSIQSTRLSPIFQPPEDKKLPRLRAEAIFMV